MTFDLVPRTLAEQRAGSSSTRAATRRSSRSTTTTPCSDSRRSSPFKARAAYAPDRRGLGLRAPRRPGPGRRRAPAPRDLVLGTTTASTRSSPASSAATTRRSPCTESAASRRSAASAKSAASSAAGSTSSSCRRCSEHVSSRSDLLGVEAPGVAVGPDPAGGAVREVRAEHERAGSRHLAEHPAHASRVRAPRRRRRSRRAGAPRTAPDGA